MNDVGAAVLPNVPGRVFPSGQGWGDTPAASQRTPLTSGPHPPPDVPKEQRLQAARAATLLLADESRDALQTLLCFLHDVVSLVEENQMTPMNLAVCLAPLALPSQPPEEGELPQVRSPRHQPVPKTSDSRPGPWTKNSSRCVSTQEFVSSEFRIRGWSRGP